MLPAGITCNVDNAYMTLVKRAFAEHAGNDKLFIRFCEAQMLWNRGMAKHLLEYIQRRLGVSVIVLAGTGHAMKPGIPREVLDDAGIEARVILPEDAVFSRDTTSGLRAAQPDATGAPLPRLTEIGPRALSGS